MENEMDLAKAAKAAAESERADLKRACMQLLLHCLGQATHIEICETREFHGCVCKTVHRVTPLHPGRYE